MRRIGTSYAKEGMVLGWPLYDMNGRAVVDAGDEMDKDSLMKLQAYGVGEIVIEDMRVNDVPVEPLIPTAEEAMLTRGISQAIEEATSEGRMSAPAVEQLHKPVNNIVTTVSESILGEPSAAGCPNTTQYNVIQPAKVAGLSMVLGIKLGLEATRIQNLGMAATLMNIGYVRFMPGMMEKKGPLSPEEWGVVVQHPDLGAEIIAASDGVDPEVAETVAQSHERYDGTGYPRGLSNYPKTCRVISWSSKLGNPNVASNKEAAHGQER